MRQLIVATALMATTLQGAEHSQIAVIEQFLLDQMNIRTVVIDKFPYTSRGATFNARNSDFPEHRIGMSADAINFEGIDSILLEREELDEKSSLIGVRILDFKDEEGRYGDPNLAWYRDSDSPDWVRLNMYDTTMKRVVTQNYNAIGAAIHNYILNLQKNKNATQPRN